MTGHELIQKAYDAILHNDFESAIEWFEQAIAMEPGNAAFHYRLSITYARSNKLVKALEHASQAIELDPDEEHYRYHLQHLKAKEIVRQAEAYLEKAGDQAWLAISLLKQAIALDSLSSEAFLLLGVAYAEVQEYSQAIAAIRELLKLDPQHEAGIRLLEECRAKWKEYMQS
ncbi:tetratricopeptide repeat protein [Paenibacillus doosanensis]|uniref:Lipoprotein NlpI n=1 Tax=Paenibacillus konkukensis TaxID=2020716 RepID=A0ABY4RHI1_9BACL|nr:MULTISPECIES: tetratricopeptide repeat protein [Paenibacillus]MCS7462499.1 tetratricopeptide repeat protein [Paenibacillus doosanensis]UQZ81894.1 lipoprotein NlpI [Paenibacillus konkukensis]